MLTVNTNVASLQAQKNLNGASFSLNKAIDHLSAGLRITSAADDASGMAQAMDAMDEIAKLNAAARDTQKGLAKVQTAEGYLNEATNILVRLDELANVTDDSASDTEVTALNARLGQISDALGTDEISAVVGDAKATNITTSKMSTSGTLTLDSVKTIREDLGATANALQGALGSLQTAIANKSGELSAIQDVDVAEETSKLSRSQVLAQAGVATLAQANQLPQMALKLLG